MKQRKIILGLLVLSVSLLALVDVEKEINEPVADMKMLDDAMNKGIKEQRERNALLPKIVEDDKSFHESPMLDFIIKGNEYILEKSVEDMNNTQIKIKLENRMLTVTEVKKTEVVVSEEVILGAKSETKRFFESTTSETLQLPNDADEKSLTSNYENNLFTVTLRKK
jgi:HSP20 family molecular chaperone IbpA